MSKLNFKLNFYRSVQGWDNHRQLHTHTHLVWTQKSFISTPAADSTAPEPWVPSGRETKVKYELHGNHTQSATKNHSRMNRQQRTSIDQTTSWILCSNAWQPSLSLVKKFFLTPNLNLTGHNLRLFPLVLYLGEVTSLSQESQNQPGKKSWSHSQILSPTYTQAVIFLFCWEHLGVPQPAAAHGLDAKAQHWVGKEELWDGAEVSFAFLLVLHQLHHIQDLEESEMVNQSFQSRPRTCVRTTELSIQNRFGTREITWGIKPGPWNLKWNVQGKHEHRILRWVTVDQELNPAVPGSISKYLQMRALQRVRNDP